MLRNTIYSITGINIIFQIIYMFFGNLSKEWFVFFFYVFRIEYMLLSGLIAFFMIFVILIFVVVSIIKTIKNGINQFYIFDIIALLLNVEYIIYYLRFLTKQ